MCSHRNPPSLNPTAAAQRSAGSKQKQAALQLVYCQNDMLAKGLTDMFAYEIKVCMFSNASIFYGTGATQRKLFPESCEELNIVRISVTAKLWGLPQNIRTNSSECSSEYTAASMFSQQQQAGIAAALQP